MKKLRGILKLLILLVPIITLMSNLSYATQDNNGPWLKLYNNGGNYNPLSNNRNSGYYQFQTTESSTTNGYQPVFKVVRTNSTGTTEVPYNQNNDTEVIYCLKNGVGFGEGNSKTFNHFTQKFDMYNYNGIDSNYREVLPSGTNYNKLLWVLDNICIPSNDASREALFTAAGVSSDAFAEDSGINVATRNDIVDAIQQIAIWKFTGNKTPADTLGMKINNESLANMGITGVDQDNLALNANKLYQYLVGSSNNGQVSSSTKPINYVAGFTDQTKPSIETIGTNYVIGPFKITGDASKLKTFTATITDGSSAISNAKVVGPDKTTEVSGNGISNKIKNSMGNNFYISIPTNSNVTNIKLDIDAKYDYKDITYWSVPVSEGLDKNQPVVIVSPTEKRDPASVQLKIEKKEFDLALRKWISKVEKADGTERYSRVRTVEVNESTLQNGTTAEYKHSKNAVEVESGDIVTYNLTIFNEGNVEGRATEIVDQLPSGLEFMEIESGDFQLVSYEKDNDNKLILSKKTEANLPAYTSGSLTSGIGTETVTIRCKVNATDANKILTNIAWISKEVNGETGEEIINQTKADRDSEPGTLPKVGNNNPSKDNMENYKGTTTDTDLNEQKYYPGFQDDDDFEKIKIIAPETPEFDLALRKFFTQIGDSAVSGREPQITQDSLRALAEGTSDAFDKTTAHKTHDKDPKNVTNGTKVVYTIRVYNEGEVDGYATEITDYLPAGLKFDENSEINKTYGWQKADEAGRVYKTAYLANTKLNKFNKTPTNGTYVMSKEGGQIADVQIECIVDTSAGLGGNTLRNIAEITKERPDGNQNIQDRDSTPGNVHHDENYNPEAPTDGKGEQDDDDFEDLKLVRFDLALRKFITGVENLDQYEEITNRIPEVDTSKFGTKGADGKEITTCEYKHTKDPVRVEQNNVVTYTIRIYNEGNTDGYAAIVKDDVPEGLEFLPNHDTNKEYRWALQEDGSITTDFLSKEQNPARLLKAFDKEKMEEPDHQDLKVAFKVTQPNTSDRIIVNSAQVTKHTDENGEEVPDIDSTPDKWIDGEDDQDREYLYVKYFNLALRKWVTHAIVIEDGVEKEMPTGHKAEDDPEEVVKVEINKKRLEETVVKFRYSIRISNIGEIAGYAKEISDYIPQGLKFNPADNPEWREVDGKIVTDQLKDTLLQPGDTATVEVVLTWINAENNMGVMTNVAEISEDYNDSHTPDINSTPNNKKPGEDDIDDAPVALTVVAGAMPTYLAISAGVTLILGAGIFLIKKFVI